MEGLAGIEDILDQKQIVALYRSVKVFDYLDFAGAFGSRAVARNRHKVYLTGYRYRSHEIRHENDRAFKDAYHEQLFVLVVLAYLPAEAGDYLMYLLFAEQYSLYILYHCFPLRIISTFSVFFPT